MNRDNDWNDRTPGTEMVPRSTPQGTAAIVRQSFDETSLTPYAETSSTALAAQAEARIKARAAIAIGRPRDMDTVRVKLLKDCERPGFAAVARYSVPRGGKKIQGPSIRFAEAAARALGNLDVFADVAFDDATKRILTVTVVDLESNHAESMPVVIDKVMERRKLRDGQEPIGTRTNSSGQLVYLVAVDEGEMPMRQGAALSKVRRNLILAHLPGDILEECQEKVQETAAKADAADPDAARKAVADSFAKIGVMPDALRDFLGVELSAASPAQIGELRQIYVGVRDGMVSWSDVMADRKGAAEPTGAVDKLKTELADRVAKKKAKATEAPKDAGKAPAAKPEAAKDSTDTTDTPPEPGSDG